MDLITFKEFEIQQLHLEIDVSQVAEIFEDLRELIIMQQPLLDNIDSNISSTKQQVNQATIDAIEANTISNTTSTTVTVIGITMGAICGGPIGILVGGKIGLIISFSVTIMGGLMGNTISKL